MRHKKGYNKLSKPTDQRLAMLQSMAMSLFRYNRIETTSARAKELRKMTDKIITLVKKGDLQSRRKITALLQHDKDLVKSIFTTKDKFNSRKSGYSRIMKTGLRKGDGAEMVLIELVDGAAV
jgi:large subunit ribosomal protein L17